MTGSFKSYEDCRSNLLSQGFKYSNSDSGQRWFVNKTDKEVAEVYEYQDKSASALIGSYL